MTYNYCQFTSPIGNLHLVSNSSALTAIIFDNCWKSFVKSENILLIEKKDNILKETEKQLGEYFTGKRKIFDIPLEFSGTDFQNQAWKSLLTIPFGKTVSYAEQAQEIKNPKAVRAIGSANGKNKICIVVPCHRVIGKNGSLTGFTAGLYMKKKLLELENQFSL